MSFLHNTAIRLGNWLEKTLYAMNISILNSPAEKQDYFFDASMLPKPTFWQHLILLFTAFTLVKNVCFLIITFLACQIFPEILPVIYMFSDIGTLLLFKIGFPIIILLLLIIFSKNLFFIIYLFILILIRETSNKKTYCIQIGIVGLNYSIITYYLAELNTLESDFFMKIALGSSSLTIILFVNILLMLVGDLIDQVLQNISERFKAILLGCIISFIIYFSLYDLKYIFTNKEYVFYYLFYQNAAKSIFYFFLFLVGFVFLSVELIHYKNRNPNVLPTAPNTNTLDEHLADNDPNN